MKPAQVISTAVVLSVLSAFITVKMTAPKNGAETVAHKETAYERVMRTQTLRCAYTPYPPFMIKDANTGKLSGIYYDVMEEIAKRLSLKLEWPEEVAPAGLFEGFKSGRYDAICAGYTRNPARSTKADFSIPVFFVPYSVFVRANDTRFDNNVSALDDPKYSFTIIDGEYASFLIKDAFPKAKVVSLPDGAISDVGVRLTNVATNKSDATIIETAVGADYMRANPGKVKPLSPPINVLPSNIILPMGDVALKSMIDAAVTNLHETGFIKKVIQAHTSGAGYYSPAIPYEAKDLSK